MNAMKTGAALILTLALASCGGEDSTAVAPDESNGRIYIAKDNGALAGRVRRMNQPVLLDNGGAQLMSVDEFTMTLVAEVDPPTVGNVTLQATSIAMDGGDKAMVSYAAAGPAFLGAVDWFTDLLSDDLELASQVTFNDTDINAVDFDGTFVYMAQGSGGMATLERLKLVNGDFSLQDNVSVSMSSFAGTGVLVASSEIYATSGDGGGLYAFNKSNLDSIDGCGIDDARWVAWDKDGERIAVVQGCPGRLWVCEEGSMDYLDTLDCEGADVPEAKSTAVIVGGKAFIAAGPEGVQIISVETGEFLGSIPVPDAEALGVDPADVVSNAVAVHEDLIFIANGAGGVTVAQGDQQFKDTDHDELPEITVLGQMAFDDPSSVNHVAYNGQYLFIAAGLGGLKIVLVEFP